MTHLQATLLMAPPQGGSPIVSFAMIGIMFMIMYFILIRPQQKERQRHQEMVAAIKKGDEVVTAGGIIGSVVHAEDDRLTIRTAESTRIVVERGKIAALVTEKGGGSSASPAS